MRTPLSYFKDKRFQDWLPAYLKHQAELLRAPKVEGPRHILFAITDHYEPLWGLASEQVGTDRVAAWEEKYPRVCGEFRDADGHHPRHSWFFPGEEYRPVFLDKLAKLARQGFGEVELHLHHDADTPENLRYEILEYLDTMGAKHGHFSRDPDGRIRYAFIHGNWCLSNSREDGRFCGVDEEIPLLYDTGCYADFTFPSVPDEGQPPIVNQIYWPTGDLSRRRGYTEGERARVGHKYDDRLLMIQGPLALNFRANLVPIRLENSHLTGGDPPTHSRIKMWVSQNIHIEGRPEWVFVKVHTHGAPEKTAVSLLGDGGYTLHRVLRDHYNDGKKYVLHYVTAREMYNVAMAAMDGESGNPNDYRDYLLAPPPVAA